MQRSRLGKGIDGFNADTNQEVNEANVIDEGVGISSEHSNGHSATVRHQSYTIILFFLMDGLDEYKPFVSKEDKKDEEGSTRRDRVRGSHTWTEEERIIAFHCLIRYRRDFDAVAEILGTKTSDKVKSFYTEMKEDIDKLLDKEADTEEEMVRSFDIEKELNIEPPKSVEIVNLD